MSASIPFSITPDAEDYLRERLREMPPEAKPVLMMTTSQTDDERPPRWHFKGRSFTIGYFDPAEKPKQEYVESELFGRPIEIEPDALKHLTDHTLSLRRVHPDYGLMDIPRYVLVADSGPKSSASTFESGERVKRGLSIAALSILGGFSGMGVTWIGTAMVALALRIPEDKFMPLAFSLLIVGWIIGATVSFLFFRSLFSPSGRTEFAQEERERRYLGYGGLGAQFGWWIFLGVPASLTGILIFAHEPLTRSNGQKAGIAVVVVMVVFGVSMYFCDRLPRRLIIWLGVVGWIVTILFGYWYFKTHGP